MCTIYPHTCKPERPGRNVCKMFSQFQLRFREPMNLWWSNTQLRVLWYPWVAIKRHGHEEVLQILLNLVERRFYFLMMTPCLLMNPLCRSIPSFATQSTQSLIHDRYSGDNGYDVIMRCRGAYLVTAVHLLTAFVEFNDHYLIQVHLLIQISLVRNMSVEVEMTSIFVASSLFHFNLILSSSCGCFYHVFMYTWKCHWWR